MEVTVDVGLSFQRRQPAAKLDSDMEMKQQRQAAVRILADCRIFFLSYFDETCCETPSN